MHKSYGNSSTSKMKLIHRRGVVEIKCILKIKRVAFPSTRDVNATIIGRFWEIILMMQQSRYNVLSLDMLQKKICPVDILPGAWSCHLVYDISLFPNGRWCIVEIFVLQCSISKQIKWCFDNHWIKLVNCSHRRSSAYKHTTNISWQRNKQASSLRTHNAYAYDYSTFRRSRKLGCQMV